MSLNESQGEKRKQNAECRKKEITKMRSRKEGEIKDTKSGMTFFRKKKVLEKGMVETFCLKQEQ